MPIASTCRWRALQPSPRSRNRAALPLRFSKWLARRGAPTEQGAAALAKPNLHKERQPPPHPERPRQWRRPDFPVHSSQLRGGEREHRAREPSRSLRGFLHAARPFLSAWEVGSWRGPFVSPPQPKLRPGSREVKGPLSLSSSGSPLGLRASAPSAGGSARGGPGGGERERACGRAPQPRAAPRPVPPASPELAPRALPGRLAPGPPPPSRGRGRGRRAAGFPSSAGAPGRASARVPAPSAGSAGEVRRGSPARRGGARRAALGAGLGAVSALTAERCGGASEDGHELRRQARRASARARGRPAAAVPASSPPAHPQDAGSSPGPRPSPLAPLAPRRRRPPAHPGAGWCPEHGESALPGRPASRPPPPRPPRGWSGPLPHPRPALTCSLAQPQTLAVGSPRSLHAGRGRDGRGARGHGGWQCVLDFFFFLEFGERAGWGGNRARP